MTAWHDEMERFLSKLESEGRAKSYWYQAKRVLEDLGERFEPESFLDLTEDQVRAWVSSLREDGLARSSVDAYLRKLRTALRYLNDGETPTCLKQVSIGSGASRIKVPSDLLTDAELDRVLRHLSPFWRTAALVLRYSGGRPGDVLGLRKKDVMFDNGRARLGFRDTKSGESREVPLVEERAVTALRQHLTTVPGSSPWVFPAPRAEGPAPTGSFRYALKKAAEDAGVDADRVYPHMLRHMRATQLARQGVTQAVADRIMGWKPGSDMWSTYTHLVTDDVEAALMEVDEAAEPEEVPPDVYDMLTAQANLIAAFASGEASAEDVKDHAAKLQALRKRAAEDIRRVPR